MKSLLDSGLVGLQNLNAEVDYSKMKLIKISYVS